MKLIVPIIATANCAQVFLSVSETAAPVMSRTPRNAERRMFQLEEQIEDWIAEAGVGPFDERNLWAYGCHCQFLGDRPLSEMGVGQPKDQIDSLCKRYHHCLQCTRNEYGSECIGERVEYGLEDSSICSDDADTCGRSLCECDSAFAREYTMLLKDGVQHNMEYHGFFNKDFVKEDECVRPGLGNGGNLECCRDESKTTPFFMINTQRQMCCKDGTSAVLGGCEEATVAPPPGYGRR